MLLGGRASAAPSGPGVSPGAGNLLLWQGSQSNLFRPYVQEAANDVSRYIISTDARDGSTDLTDWLLLGSGDFDGDGDGDYLWLNKWSGDVTIWLMRGTFIKSRSPFLGQVPRLADGSPAPAFIADMDQDGKSEVIWELDALPPSKTNQHGIVPDPDGIARYRYKQWRFDLTSVVPVNETSGATKGRIRGIGQFNGTGGLEMVTTGGDQIGTVHTYISFGDGTSREGPIVTSTMQVKGVGDFDGNGTTDLVWQRTGTGDVTVWEMADARFVRAYSYYPAKNWTFGGVGDLDRNGVSDMLWRNRDGLVWIWSFNSKFQVHYGVTGLQASNDTLLVGTTTTRQPLGTIYLIPWLFLPSSATRCPDFDMSIIDDAGASVVYHMPRDGDNSPTPQQSGIGANGNKHCDYNISHTGESGTYTLTTTLGANGPVRITPNDSASVRICVDGSGDGTTCKPVANDPSQPPPPQTILFNLSLFGGLPNYQPQTNEPIWYLSGFPAFAGSGTLLNLGATGAIRIPTKGNTVTDCNDPQKSVLLGANQSLGASGMMKVFGASTVPFTGASAIQLAACRVGPLDSAVIPSTLPVQVTIQKTN
jgi:hypothetical protein